MILEEKMRIIEYYKMTLTEESDTVILTNYNGESQEFNNVPLEDVATAVITQAYNNHLSDQKNYLIGATTEFYSCPIREFYSNEEKKTAAFTGQHLAGCAELGIAIYEIMQGGYDEYDGEIIATKKSDTDLTLEEFWFSRYLELALEFNIDTSKVKLVYEKLRSISESYAELYSQYLKEFNIKKR